MKRRTMIYGAARDIAVMAIMTGMVIGFMRGVVKLTLWGMGVGL